MRSFRESKSEGNVEWELEQPSLDVLEAVLLEEEQKEKRVRIIRRVIYTLLVIAALAVLIVLLVFPVLKINGTSMTETLQDGDIVISTKTSNIKQGDIIAFYYNNNVLVKRVVAKSGDWVDMDEEGLVYVNGLPLDEPYITEKAVGECDIALPYQVPEGKLFVMGDHRATSIDSRNSTIGCISDEMIVGKLVWCAWPVRDIGIIH